MKREALLKRYKKNKSSEKGNSNDRKRRKFKPQIGEQYKIRIFPWNPKDAQEEWDPFQDMYFYFGLVRYGIPTLSQHGKDDPVQETINTMIEDGTPTNDPVLKKLYPKKRTFGPVIVEGQEDKGVQYWEYGVTVENQLLEILNDDEYGDVMDFSEGRELKVSVTKSKKATYPETTVLPGGTPKPVTKSKKQLNEWLSNLPDLSDDYEEKSYDELSKILDAYLGSDNDEEEEKEETRGKRSKKAAKNAGSSSEDDDDDDFNESDDEDDEDVDVDEAFADLADDDE